MPTYVVTVHLREIVPVARSSTLDEVMVGFGFFPWRPGVPPEDEDAGVGFSRWEYAGNHALDAESLKETLVDQIMTEVQSNIDVTVTRVTVTVSGNG